MTPLTMTPRKRKKSERELARNIEYQKEYYAANRDELLKKKKERYQGDPEYRRGIKVRAKRKRWLEERPEQKEFPPFGILAELEPKGSIEVKVKDRHDARHGQTVSVPVFSTGAVAELLGRAPEVLRLWWKRKQIPEPYHRGSMVPENMVKGRNPRLFTLDEMRAIDNVKEMLNLPSRGSSHALFSDRLTEEFEKMDQGLYQVPNA